MIPGCHSVVTSWDYVGVGCAYVVLASSWLWSLVFCWGLAIAPQTPYRRNNKQGLSLHQKSWVTKAGGRECVVATPFNLTPLEGWVNLGELVKDTRQ